MKNLFKKNQLMITALAIMIAIAGYLQFAGNTLEEEYLSTGEGSSLTVDSDGVITENLVAGTLENTEDPEGSLLELSEEDLLADGLTEIDSLDSDVEVLAEDYLEDSMDILTESMDILTESMDILTQSADVLDGTNVTSEEGLTVADTGEEEEGVVIADAGEEGEGITVADAGEDSSDLAEVEPDEGEVPGEAVFTSANGVTVLSEAKLLKEQTRAKNKETLLEIINSAGLTDAQKQEAVDTMVEMTQIAEKEAAAEILLEAKGFADAVVSIDGDTVDVVINAVTLTEAQRAQIEDIVKRKTEVSAENIVISTIVSQD